MRPACTVAVVSNPQPAFSSTTSPFPKGMRTVLKSSSAVNWVNPAVIGVRHSGTVVG